MGEGNVLTRVCPSVCPQGGRGGSGPAGGRGGSAGGRVGSAGGGVGQVQPGGGVGQVQPGGRGGSAGGKGWVSRGEGWVSRGGRGGSATGGEGWVRSRPGGMPLAFTQEDFLVLIKLQQESRFNLLFNEFF